MRADEIRELSDDEVQSRIAELEEERFRLRFRSATETLEDPLRLRAVRREVARLKTIVLERVRGGTVGQGGTVAAAAKPAAAKGASRKAATGGRTAKVSKGVRS